MTTFTDLLHDEKQADRLAKYVISENPNIKNFEDFENATKMAFGKDARGQGILSFLNDEESKLLFESNAIQNQLKRNVGDEEYEQVYGEASEMDVIRKVPKGEPTKQSDIIVITVPKPVKVSEYTKEGHKIASYSKSYKTWSPAQTHFLKSQRAKNISTRQIVSNYNAHFKEEQRSPSSLRTKVYRLAK